MSGSGKKAIEAAAKAGKAIDWEGMAKLLVTDDAKREFVNLRRAFDEVNHALQTKYSQEPEPIDWGYYRKGIGSRLVDMYKEAFDSIKIPKFVDTVTPQYKPKFDALLVELKEAEEKSLKESERLEKEIAEVQELKKKISTMTADEYFEKHPELRKKFDDEIRNDYWGDFAYYQIDTLLSTFQRWEQLQPDGGDYAQLLKELLAGCDSVEWQVDELEKAIAVSESNPSRFGIDEVELEKRKRWTTASRTEVDSVRRSLEDARVNTSVATVQNGMNHELRRLTNTAGRTDHYYSKEHDDYISSETDQQMLLIRRQDEELDELSASVQRIGGVGLTIHEELMGQEKILDDLNQDMDSTSNRLDFVQKKVAMVMKKASAKGQITMIVFLLVLFFVLFVLVFLT